MAINKVNNIGITGHSQVNFTGAYSESGIYQAKNALKKEILDKMPQMKMIDKFKSFKGEVPTILINALGTGLVAPVFIKYNFLSKSDSETRTYSAWRQPVSAVLAVITQAGLVIPFNKIISNQCNAGRFTDKMFNKTAFQDIAYIEKLVKKNNPSLNKEAVKDLAKKVQLDQFQSLIDNMKEHNTIRYIADGKEVVYSAEEFKKVVMETTKGLKSELDSNIKRYDNEKLKLKTQRGEFLRTNSVETKAILAELAEKANSTKEEKEVMKFVKDKLTQLKSNKANPELIKIVDNISKQGSLDLIKDKISQTTSKADFFSALASKDDVVKTVGEEIAKRKTAFEGQKAILEEIEKGISSNKKLGDMQKLIQKFNGNMHYEIAQKYTQLVESNIKGKMQVVGLLVSLAILPVSCSLLNALYPKFMDLMFPEMSRKKHSKEKDKFVKECDSNKGNTSAVSATKKADKKQEVK